MNLECNMEEIKKKIEQYIEGYTGAIAESFTVELTDDGVNEAIIISTGQTVNYDLIFDNVIEL